MKIHDCWEQEYKRKCKIPKISEDITVNGANIIDQRNRRIGNKLINIIN